jgi:hypothetical protein
VVKPQITFAVTARPPEGAILVPVAPGSGLAPATNGRARGTDAVVIAPVAAFAPPKRGLIYRLIERIRRM